MSYSEQEMMEKFCPRVGKNCLATRCVAWMPSFEKYAAKRMEREKNFKMLEEYKKQTEGRGRCRHY